MIEDLIKRQLPEGEGVQDCGQFSTLSRQGEGQGEGINIQRSLTDRH